MGINAITADVLDSLQALVRPGGRAATLGTQDIQPEVLAARAARLDPALAGQCRPPIPARLRLGRDGGHRPAPRRRCGA
jgi:hypothetical protein